MIRKLLLKTYIQKEISKTQIYKSGLVHHIYKFGRFVVKVPKVDFPDFNTHEHFLIERNSLRVLGKNMIPVPKVTTVSNFTLSGVLTHCLIESFVSGTQLTWDSLDQYKLSQIADVYHRCHNIRVKGFGPLDGKLKGKFNSWIEYLNDSIECSQRYFTKHLVFHNSIDLFILLKNTAIEIENSGATRSSRFIFADLNPGNIFFDKKGNIMSVTDIDHPMGGDRLYDFAAVLWYNSKAFWKLQHECLQLSTDSLRIVWFYSIIHGFEVITWMNRHEQKVSKDIKHLNENVKYFINSGSQKISYL